MRNMVPGRCTHPLVRTALACCCLAVLPPASGALSLRPAAPVVIGVVLPQDDGALNGVRLGTTEAERTAALLRESFAVHFEHAEGVAAAAAALRLIRTHGVHVIIGGADGAAASALMSIADEHGVLFINVGAAEDSLRARCPAATLHLLPSSAMRARALALAGAGDSAAAWHDSLERYGAGQVGDRYRARFGTSVGEREWAGWMAVKIAWESAQRAPSSSGADLVAYAADSTTSFDGHKGLPLSFHPDTRQLRQPLYVLAGDSVIAEVPAPRDEPELDAPTLLDRLLTPAGKVPCAAH